jgi:predicted permease
MYEYIRDHNDVFSGVLLLNSGSIFGGARMSGVGVGDLRVSPVTADYFSVLAVKPTIGRFPAGDDYASGQPAVLSYGAWQRAFGGDAAILGKSLRLGNRNYTLVGVGPKDFKGVATGQPVDLWVPITWINAQALQNPEALMFRIIARRKPGVTEAAALANMQVLSRQWSTAFKFDGPTRVEVASASRGLSQLRRRFSSPLLILMIIVGALLLIAATNIACLLLARATARRREMGVRLSLGASRSRLVRQLLTESMVLGGVGGALGLMLAPIAASFLLRFLKTAVAGIDLPFTVDLRVLIFTAATSLGVVLLFGLAPALAATRLDLYPLFRGGAFGGEARRIAPGKLLLLIEVSISCVLLAGAILFARSLQKLNTVDAGFQPENIALMQLFMAEPAPAVKARAELFQRVLDQMMSVPGVLSTGLSSERLFSGNTWTEAIAAPGFVPAPGEGSREAVILVVSPGFFRTMNTTMLRGRDFETRDNVNALRVAIVNEAMARYYLGGTDVLGKTFQIARGDDPHPLTVIGVVRDAKYRNLRDASPRMVYLPYLQNPELLDETNVAVRTSGDPEKMVDALWQAARNESPLLRLGNATTQSRLVNATIAQDRMLAHLSAVFGFAAAVLVCAGLYGLTSYEVSRRTAEIGLRIALGARSWHVIRMVLAGSMALVGAGVCLGLAGALVLGRLIEGVLFGVKGSDVVTLALTVITLMSVGAVAAYRPAVRAANLDPLISLKRE